MKTILLKIDYTDSTGKFWFDSYIKNKEITFDPEKETIHDVIKRECAEEGMYLSYKGKPTGNVYRDTKDGEIKAVGYMYRGKTEIFDRDMPKPKTALFDVWATIKAISEFHIENVDMLY